MAWLGFVEKCGFLEHGVQPAVDGQIGELSSERLGRIRGAQRNKTQDVKATNSELAAHDFRDLTIMASTGPDRADSDKAEAELWDPKKAKF